MSLSGLAEAVTSTDFVFGATAALAFQRVMRNAIGTILRQRLAPEREAGQEAGKHLAKADTPENDEAA